jgi:hypothetical protein
MRTPVSLLLIFSLALAFLPGCGGDDESPNVVATIPGNPDGHFYDSEVQGLSYASGDVTGTTEADGKFRFEADSDAITFNIGDISLGSATPSAVMTPITMVVGASTVTNETVTNIARLLQTIDDDGNPSNGIVITSAVRAAAAGQIVNFAQSVAAFEADADVLAAISDLTTATAAGERALIAAATAQTNLAAGIRAGFMGEYGGDFCRYSGEAEVKGGTWDMDVSADGNVSIGFDGTPSFIITGPMDLTGTVSLAQLGGATIYGSFQPDFEGVWYYGEYSGRFSEEDGCSNNH